LVYRVLKQETRAGAEKPRDADRGSLKSSCGTCGYSGALVMSCEMTAVTRTATRSCRTRKRAFHFYSPGAVRRCSAAAAAAAATAAGAAVYRQFDDYKLLLIK